MRATILAAEGQADASVPDHQLSRSRVGRAGKAVGAADPPRRGEVRPPPPEEVPDWFRWAVILGLGAAPALAGGVAAVLY